jgi:hypothetical protein
MSARAEAKSATRPAPAIGDFVVRPAYDGRCGARVVRKTGDRYIDVDWSEIATRCETDDAARRLAELLNAARSLMCDWQDIQSRSPFLDGDAEAWVKHIVVDNVAKAIGGPRPEPLAWIKLGRPVDLPEEDPS